MIEVTDLTKRYGDVLAVDDISFTVRPGIVTGFLGPNGAGKSTTMRMIVGLDRPTSGRALVNGREFRDAPAPLGELGAMLDAKSVGKRRSARNHLLAIGATAGIGAKRVDETLELVGLSGVANKDAAQFSLGMSQRLGIATALLGDPETLMLDEPVNGLDPDGIRWIRQFLRQLAAEGRTIFLSSHLMSEVEQTVDHLLVIGKGKLLADMPIQDFLRASSQRYTSVRSPQAEQLAAALAGPGVTVTDDGPGHLQVTGRTPAQVGDVAAAQGFTLHELVEVEPSLESAYMELTHDSVVFQAPGGLPPGDPAGAGSTASGPTTTSPTTTGGTR